MRLRRAANWWTSLAWSPVSTKWGAPRSSFAQGCSALWRTSGLPCRAARCSSRPPGACASSDGATRRCVELLWHCKVHGGHAQCGWPSFRCGGSWRLRACCRLHGGVMQHAAGSWRPVRLRAPCKRPGGTCSFGGSCWRAWLRGKKGSWLPSWSKNHSPACAKSLGVRWTKCSLRLRSGAPRAAPPPHSPPRRAPQPNPPPPSPLTPLPQQHHHPQQQVPTPLPPHTFPPGLTQPLRQRPKRPPCPISKQRPQRPLQMGGSALQPTAQPPQRLPPPLRSALLCCKRPRKRRSAWAWRTSASTSSCSWSAASRKGISTSMRSRTPCGVSSCTHFKSTSCRCGPLLGIPACRPCHPPCSACLPPQLATLPPITTNL
mmetsp:Transcript_16832/g.46428  ORF Transcript_16832/g.46428 Transcript_16832/m.46428 type:complete len:374 (+) Transcript_16832:2451-3572(+)